MRFHRDFILGSCNTCMLDADSVEVVSANVIILAVSVSAAIGIIFGLYPGYRAARLSPVEALRYE